MKDRPGSIQRGTSFHPLSSLPDHEKIATIQASGLIILVEHIVTCIVDASLAGLLHSSDTVTSNPFAGPVCARAGV